jgi:phosphate starvation-inducible PhoH-like protein
MRNNKNKSNTFSNIKPRRNPSEITLNSLIELEPLTDNQEKFFDLYDEGKHLVAHGVPGSGKTILAVYKALEDVLDKETPYEKVIIFKNMVQSYDLGYLKGSMDDKTGPFETPYKYVIKKLFNIKTEEENELFYGRLKTEKLLEFSCVSFLRGATFDNCIMIIDEVQNLNGHLLSSVITRIGTNTKIIFVGDVDQSDLTHSNDRKGLVDFMKILKNMPSFGFVEFEIDDIVRSQLVKEFVITKKGLNITL